MNTGIDMLKQYQLIPSYTHQRTFPVIKVWHTCLSKVHLLVYFAFRDGEAVKRLYKVQSP